MDATLDRSGDRPVLRFERVLRHPPEKVWRAVTEPAELARWFPAKVAYRDGRPQPGTPMTFTFDGHDIASPGGEVLVAEPPTLFVYRWGDDEFRWEISPAPGGCRLRFTHTFGGTEVWGDWRTSARQAAGWDVCLDLLGAALDERPSTSDDWFARNEFYVERFGLARGEVRESADGWVLRFERDLVQPAQAAWATLLDGGPAPAVGGRPPVRFTNGYVPAGHVIETDPPDLLGYEWLHNGTPAGHVRWRFTGQPVGCRLVLTQAVPARLHDVRATALAAWQTHLELFVAALHGQVREWPDRRTEALAQEYAARLG